MKNPEPGSYYSVAVGNLSVSPLMRKNNKRFIKLLKSCEGLAGVHPQYPAGTLIFFDTVNHAKTARNRLEAAGVQCGCNICEFKLDGETMNFVGGID